MVVTMKSARALLLILLGLFLYSRLAGGTLVYYINERFAWLTLLAVIGLLVVGVGYGRAAQRDTQVAHEHEGDHDDHHHAAPSAVGLALVALPIALGLLVPPEPLGTAALAGREVRASDLAAVAADRPDAPQGERNILDWLVAFNREPDPEAFAGEEARVIGFVYRAPGLPADAFLVSRFMLSCCAADATPIGLVVRWPDVGTLADDQWVEVSGRFEPGELDGQTVNLLVAAQVTRVEPPAQPYLYP
jgi:uncharacterized repeat protein (TIGR03943 family)